MPDQVTAKTIRAVVVWFAAVVVSVGSIIGTGYGFYIWTIRAFDERVLAVTNEMDLRLSRQIEDVDARIRLELDRRDAIARLRREIARDRELLGKVENPDVLTGIEEAIEENEAALADLISQTPP